MTITCRPCPDSASCSKVPSSASLLSLDALFKSDADDGTLEQLALSGQGLHGETQRKERRDDQEENQRLQQLIRPSEAESELSAHHQKECLPDADLHHCSSSFRVCAATF